MPKYGIHSIVMQEATKSLPDDIKTIMENNRGAALLGSVGPDLLFFSPEYKAFNFFVQLAHNLKHLKALYGEVLDSVKEVLEPIEEALEDLVEPIDEAVETVEKILPLECATDLVGDCKSAAATFKSAMHETLLVGMNEGIDIIDQAADLPSFSQTLFDELFTPAHQHGKREWDWYWFDMLHYRNTGLFAKNLVKLAVTDIQKAYALGYLTHIATDTTGHAFVNRIVCGPYRLHPQRHVIIENFMDSYEYYRYYGVSVNKALDRDLLSTMEADGVCDVDEYSGYVKSFNPELRDMIYEAFRLTYPDTPTTQGDPKPPHPDFLSKEDVEKTFENFHVTMSYLRDSYVEKPEGLDERYAQVADALNEILSNFEAPPSPPSIGNTHFCLDWECVKHFFEQVNEWMSYFAELAKWTFDTIVNALDLLLEIFCQASIAVVRAIMYLVEYLSYDLYQHMHFILALNGFVWPEPTHAVDDPRGEGLVHTALTASRLVGDCNVSVFPPVCESAYPHQHDPMAPALKPPVSDIERPATNFPRTSADDYPDWFISDAPWQQIEDTLRVYAESPSPEDSRSFAYGNSATQLGNAVEFSAWMMEKALEIKEFEKEYNEPHELSHIVHCNWDLDGDRGYAYKQWFTDKDPSVDNDLGDKFLDEDLSRD